MASLVDTLALTQLRSAGYRSRYLSTRLGTMHALEAEGSGSLPPVVLLHGVSARGTHYRGVVPALRGQVSRVILPDLLGHGLSEVPRAGLSVDSLTQSLIEALDELIDAPALIFGNSLGGMMAIRYAAARPEKVLALAVNSPAGGAVSAEERQLLIDRFSASDHQTTVELVQRAIARPLPSAAQHIMALQVRRQLSAPHVADLLRGVTQKDELSPEELGRLVMPTLFTWGKAERVLLDSQLSYFLEHLPKHVEVEHPEGFGHSPHLDQPAALAERILRLARSVSEPPSPTPAERDAGAA